MLSDEEWSEVETIERSRDSFEAMCLRSPELLPDIPVKGYSLIWDYLNGMTVIQLGDMVMFSEAAFYEGYRRFEDES